MYALEAVGSGFVPEMRPGLSRLIAPLEEGEFLRDHLGRRPLLLMGRPGRFGALFGWADLNELLAASRVDPARMHLSRALQGVPVTSCAEPLPQLAPRGRPLRLRPDRVREALQEGATLAIDGVEEVNQRLRSLVASVEQSLGALVQANLYANLGGAAEGFGIHWDDHDVLIIQAEGAKHWEVHAPTQEVPVGVLSAPEPPTGRRPYWTGTLTDGDVLYLPRGWWHRVTPGDGPSLHLTLGARLPSVGDVLSRLLRHMAAEQPAVRYDLPRYADEHTTALFYEELRAVLTKTIREAGLLERLAEEVCRAAVGERPVFTLPYRDADADADADAVADAAEQR
ncbi:JmjC domain-containing protein [Streptomyces sp. NPDC020794]|uniref:JmjC domain-containing protein n=1 Tax=unclassified Streptomyces TaxID=2593676 RepID=UPI0036DFC4B1